MYLLKTHDNNNNHKKGSNVTRFVIYTTMENCLLKLTYYQLITELGT